VALLEWYNTSPFVDDTRPLIQPIKKKESVKITSLYFDKDSDEEEDDISPTPSPQGRSPTQSIPDHTRWESLDFDDLDIDF
jgi:hypothetical protein